LQLRFHRDNLKISRIVIHSNAGKVADRWRLRSIRVSAWQSFTGFSWIYPAPWTTPDCPAAEPRDDRARSAGFYWART
jgi:hypothetical protein